MSQKKVIAIPPGETIKEQLDIKNMSRKELAHQMDMQEWNVNKLINGGIRITPDVAVKLEMVFGVPAHFWINLDSIYREKLKAYEDIEVQS